MNFGKRLLALRKRADITQTQLAALFWSDYFRILRWEKNYFRPPAFPQELLSCLELAEQKDPNIVRKAVATASSGDPMRALFQVLCTIYREEKIE